MRDEETGAKGGRRRKRKDRRGIKKILVKKLLSLLKIIENTAGTAGN
jgi:hypothetical protein